MDEVLLLQDMMIDRHEDVDDQTEQPRKGGKTGKSAPTALSLEHAASLFGDKDA